MAGSRQALGGRVYNFSTSLGKVVANPVVEAFNHKLKRAYAGDDIPLHFGIAP